MPGDQIRRRYVNFRAARPENMQSIRVQTRQKSKSDSLLGKKKQGNVQRNYNCFTEYNTPDTWLAGSGRRLDEAINLCLNKISQQIKTAVLKEA